MANLVVAAVVLFVIGAAVAYIIKEKKKGTRCIGCLWLDSAPESAQANARVKRIPVQLIMQNRPVNFFHLLCNCRQVL